MIPSPRFFTGPTEKLAQNLLGMLLVHETSEGRVSGRIVETEAYLFRNDPACHAHRGMTKRNEAMFGRAGTSYIYLIYGMYHCFNVVSGKTGEGEAVLIRALEPIEGLDLMQARRRTKRPLQGKQPPYTPQALCNGPGKLVIALGITPESNGACLRESRLRIEKSGVRRNESIDQSSRIGITKGLDLPLRFYFRNNPFVSKR